MARISVEQKALTDPRFQLLGRLLGHDRFHALGIMCLVWNECQEQGTYHLSRKVLNVLLGDKEGARKLIESGLGVRNGRGEIRIRGTQGRIEWLKRKRLAAKENGKKGGRPKTNIGSTSVRGRLQQETPPAPAPTLGYPSDNPLTSSTNVELFAPSDRNRSEPFYPIRATDGQFRLDQSTVDQWRRCYPAVDVELEVQRAEAWMDSKPRNRKTVRGMKAFLRGWIERSHNRAPVTEQGIKHEQRPPNRLLK